MQIKSVGLFELVKSYLVHYAYVETLQALEEESTTDAAALILTGEINIEEDKKEVNGSKNE